MTTLLVISLRHLFRFKISVFLILKLVWMHQEISLQNEQRQQDTPYVHPTTITLNHIDMYIF